MTGTGYKGGFLTKLFGPVSRTSGRRRSIVASANVRIASPTDTCPPVVGTSPRSPSCSAGRCSVPSTVIVAVLRMSVISTHTTPNGASPDRPASAECHVWGRALLEPGDSIELAAVDPQGEWGTVRIERGEDLGGYADAEIGPDAFIVEFFVEYSADRLPDPDQFGASDWSLRPTDPEAEHFFLVEPMTFERSPSGVRPDQSLGMYPGAIDIFSTPTEGWIAFQVQRRVADL